MSWTLKLYTLYLYIFETILLEYGLQRLINDEDMITQSSVNFRFSTHDPHTHLSNWVTSNSLDAPCGLWRACTRSLTAAQASEIEFGRDVSAPATLGGAHAAR